MIISFLERLLHTYLNKHRHSYYHSTPLWVNDFIKDVDDIILEWTNYTKSFGHGVQIDELSNIQSHLNQDKKWKSIFLYCFSYLNNNTTKYFPTLTSKLKKHRRKINLMFFSTTEAKKIIPPHIGRNSGVLRLQLGIDIEEPEKCYLRIEEKRIYLKNKEILIFDDTFEHELVNDSDHNRTVLIIDYFKPLPLFYDLINRAVLRKMSKSEHVQSLINKL